MEFFNYADWLAEGRRLAKGTGNPDLDTEMLHLDVQEGYIEVVYTVDLKTTGFRTVVDKFSGESFSARFFNMLEVEGQV